jgi:hypothetical protein
VPSLGTVFAAAAAALLAAHSGNMNSRTLLESSSSSATAEQVHDSSIMHAERGITQPPPVCSSVLHM